MAPIGVRWTAKKTKTGLKPDGDCPVREFVPCFAVVNNIIYEVKQQMSPVEQIQKLITEHVFLADVLCELVHDMASRRASDANNAGLKDQLELLNAGGMTDEEVLKGLQEATE